MSTRTQPDSLDSPEATTHPVRVRLADDLRRGRLTVLLRSVLALPHLVWLTLWSWAIVVLVPFEWIVVVCTGRMEEDVHSFLARYVRYQAHVAAYLFLLARPWPGFHGRREYPLDVEIDPPTRQNRAGVLLRPVLAAPALLLGTVFSTILVAVAVGAWFVALVLGRMPDGLEELGAYCLRYQTQMYAYLLVLTGRYPSVSGPPLRDG